MKNDFIESLIKLFGRDLDKLANELTLYADEKTIWAIRGEIKNPAGNLCLHLCGNLQHYIGYGIGQIRYVRDRDKEFAAKDIPLNILLKEVAQTKMAVLSSVQKLDPAVLEKPYPLPVFDFQMTYTYFLIHLAGHLNYHLGQINYHRRLVSSF